MSELETLAQGEAEAVDTPVETTETKTETTETKAPVETETKAPVETKTETTETKAPDKAPAWPEDWREKLAGGDEKKLKQLQRYSDPAAFANKTFSLEAKLSSGEYRRPLPKDASPEQVAEWRQENGLPEAPDKYDVSLPDGIVLGETDKQTLEGFQKFAFENNLSGEVLNKTLSWYYAEQDRATQQQQIADADFHEVAKDELMSEWGLKDYRQNIAAMSAIRDQMPEGLADRVLAGRTSDGHLIGDDPTFLRWFASLAREMNPTATVVAVDSGKTLESELDTIRAFRRENPDKYDADKKMQERERELLSAQLRVNARKG